ncbi:MAG: peroxiredoxin-like family protein [Bryobacteraceae bacterium]
MKSQALQRIVRTLETARTESGERLADLYRDSPLLLVFLRHSGCPFCREALSDLSVARAIIQARGIRIVLVHMRDRLQIDKLLQKYDLTGLDRICDPAQELHRAFGLSRGRFGWLFQPQVLWRGFAAAVLERHGLGRLTADISQMPGLFLIDRDGIVKRFRHRTPADRPDYLKICASLTLV